MIDLHSHTTASDGQYTPTELVRQAWAAGVRTLALTDHDTVAGIEEARQAALSLGLELIPGIELSAFLGDREVHILGHFVDPTCPSLTHWSERLGQERHIRMLAMLEKLRGLGIAIPLPEVVAESGGKNLGRPHLARALVNRGLCVDVKEAFDRYLGNGGPAFVERFKLGYREAIALIGEARGAATIAHPGVNKLEKVDIARLREAGLAGMEVLHSDHPPSMREKYVAIARDLDLVPTAGSDFHGEKVVPHRKLGTAHMDPAAFEKLRGRAPRSPA